MLSFILLALANIAIVTVADWLLRRREGGLNVPATLFFLLLLTLIVTLPRPVAAGVRRAVFAAQW